MPNLGGLVLPCKINANTQISWNYVWHNAEHMDVDSERIEVSDAPGTTRESNIISDLTQIDSNDPRAGINEKPSFGSGACDKPPTGNWRSLGLETNRDELRKVSRERYDNGSTPRNPYVATIFIGEGDA